MPLGSNVNVMVIGGAFVLNLFSPETEQYEQITLLESFLDKMMPVLHDKPAISLDDLELLQHLGDWHAMLVNLGRFRDATSVSRRIREITPHEDIGQAVCDAGKTALNAMSEPRKVAEAWVANWQNIRKEYNI